MLNGKVPARETLVTFLAVCGVGAADEQRWLAAWQRVRDDDPRRPPGGVRVRDASPRELGVHAAIQGRAGDSGELPVYVPRDVDAGLRAAVSAGAERGCFLLLVGSSSVGKTRSAYEAVLACAPDWWLVQPADADGVWRLAAAPVPRTVVWLDELQRYLGERGLAAETVRELRRAGAVVIGTLWPDEYLARTVPRAPGTDDPYAGDRALLDLAEVVDVADTLSGEERGRAAALAATDSRLRVALETAGAGTIQVLAAGPALVRWWEQSPDPYAKAVITAAVDARRLGARTPLTTAFLAAAAAGYLTPAQWATAPPGWVDAALSYALTPLHGAAATLAPVPAAGGEPGRIGGYAIADYLLQHARRTRRAACLPAACWQAMVEHIHDRDDTLRLAAAAQARMRYLYEELLCRRLAAGDAEAADSLATLLERQDRIDEAVAALRPHAAGTPYAEDHLVDLLLAHGRADEAIAVLWPPDRPSRASWSGADKLVEQLVRLGRAEQAAAVLRPRAGAGDADAAYHLAALLVHQGRTGEAITVLRAHSGDSDIDSRLASLLDREGRSEEIIDLMRPHMDAGGPDSSPHFAMLLAEHGRIDELRQRVAAGDEWAVRPLADWLADNACIEELTALVDSRRAYAPLDYSDWLTETLFELGRVDELRVRADAGDRSAPWRLAELLIAQGRMRDLQERVEAGDHAATWRLAQHLEGQGRVDEAIEMLRAWGDAAGAGGLLAGLLAKQTRTAEAIDALRPSVEAGDLTARHAFADLLVKHGRIDELRQRAGAGDDYATWRLVDLLIGHGQLDEAIHALQALAGTGDWPANRRLDELLADEGRLDALRERADAGHEQAARRLADLLAGQGDIDGLRARADAGDSHALWRLRDLLAGQGRAGELKERADAGDHEAAKRLTNLLAEQERIDELRAEVDAGTHGAAERLIAAITARGGLDRYSAAHVSAFGFTADGAVWCEARPPA
ncbi:hypothetical protein [Phytohabitans houttuyneae]|uniref:Uncharacterized protein n=2 Tax=Phytohabitans houttuyneae TaxID=1076126 RepID=A0A6V8KFQ1_9ACTN|nr:hypothetical protein [Phytohabitans houttuyneae]GFJ81311.1 hypothetical protein Phou_054910 [Phytohabitans houttuyneae]